MVLFALALIATSVLILVLRAVAHHCGLLDHPGGRKHHDCPTPTVGGIAMFAAVALTLYFARAYTDELAVLMGCAGALVVLGVLDDRFGLNVKLRLTLQALLSLVVIFAADGAITHLGALVGGADITLGLLAVPFSMVAFVGGINAMNMIDGADGMAGKMAIITVAGVGAICYFSGDVEMLPLVIALLGALGGFLLFNTRMFVSRAWIFMGDAGSMWLGLVLGWFMAQVTHGPESAQPALVFWLFGIPVIDTLAVITRRLRRNASPFSPDRTHIHHVFQHNGLTVRRTVLVLSVIQAILVGTGVLFYMFKVSAPVVFGSFLLVMVAYAYGLQRFHRIPVDLVRTSGRDKS